MGHKESIQTNKQISLIIINTKFLSSFQQAHSHPVARLEAYSAADYVTKAGSEDMGPISDGDDEDDDSGNDDNNETLDDRYGGNYDERDDEDDWNGYADRKNTQDLKKDYDLKVENDAEFIFDNDNNNVKSDVSNSLNKIYDRIDVDVDDAMIDDEAQLKRHIRSKRASGVNEQWRQSLPGYRRVHQHNEDDMEWQVCFICLFIFFMGSGKYLPFSSGRISGPFPIENSHLFPNTMSVFLN